jgi:hypothetical protein
MAGWEFRGGGTSVTVAEPDVKAAEVIARCHLGGEPNGEPRRACDEVFNIYGIKRSGVLIARIRPSAPAHAGREVFTLRTRISG